LIEFIIRQAAILADIGGFAFIFVHIHAYHCFVSVDRLIAAAANKNGITDCWSARSEHKLPGARSHLDWVAKVNGTSFGNRLPESDEFS
jgi:hypothetical protein